MVLVRSGFLMPLGPGVLEAPCRRLRSVGTHRDPEGSMLKRPP